MLPWAAPDGLCCSGSSAERETHSSCVWLSSHSWSCSESVVAVSWRTSSEVVPASGATKVGFLSMQVSTWITLRLAVRAAAGPESLISPIRCRI